MTAVLQKWGNSQGIRLPKRAIKDLSINIGDILEIEEIDDKLIISKSKKKPKYDIAKLASKIPADYEQSEYDTSDAVGAEVW